MEKSRPLPHQREELGKADGDSLLTCNQGLPKLCGVEDRILNLESTPDSTVLVKILCRDLIFLSVKNNMGQGLCLLSTALVPESGMVLGWLDE